MLPDDATYHDVAVLVPCRDEALTIARVVRDFHAHLPGARVVVCDNASTDATAERAAAAGAEVLVERRPGKGFAVRRLFADVEADYYVLVDGDATYDAGSAPEMVAAMRERGVDTVLGVRRAVGGGAEYRSGHRLGNALFSRTFSTLFDTVYTDVLTGYRGFSRRFVKSCPLLARGFDVEIELNAHGASLGVPHAEVETAYRERPADSHSKLSTYGDGLRISRRMARLYRDFKPWLCFGLPGLAVGLLGLGIFVPILLEFQDTGRVARYPTLFVVVGMMLAGLVLTVFAAILERSTRDRLERNRLAYLSHVSPWRSRPTTGAPGSTTPGAAAATTTGGTAAARTPEGGRASAARA